MEYLFQSVVFFLAILGAFFKCVKEDPAGKILRTKRGVPKPTVAGVTILLLLTVSFIVSSRITWSTNLAEAETKRELAKLETITKQNATLQSNVEKLSEGNRTLQSQLQTTGEQFKRTIVELDLLRDQIESTSKNSALQRDVQRLSQRLQEADTEIKKSIEEAADNLKQIPTEPTTGWITVHNKYRGEISLWVDDATTVLQSNEGTSIEVQYHGSTLRLYSCGWLASQTSPGQASGCRFIPYTVLPGQEWEIVGTPPAPRIVMRPVH